MRLIDKMKASYHLKLRRRGGFWLVLCVTALYFGLSAQVASAAWVFATSGGGTSPPYSDPGSACQASFVENYPTVVPIPAGSQTFYSYITGAPIQVECSWKWIPGAYLYTQAVLQCPSGTVGASYASGGCAPAIQDDRGPPGCNKKAGDPINVISGSETETINDFTTRGDYQLRLDRHYDSKWIATSRLGAGWRTNFDRTLSYSNMFYVSIVLGDGRQAIFVPASSGSTSWVTGYADSSGNLHPNRTDASWSIVQNSTTWVFTDTDGAIETYNSSGQLISIVKRGGYTQIFAYDSNGNNISVTDSFNRQILFTYSAYGILTSVTAPDGQIYQYAYQDQTPKVTGGSAVASLALAPNTTLTQVTYPATTGAVNPFVTYLYEDNTNLTALTGVNDERGVRISTWTYDSQGNALSSQQAGGVDQTSIQYDFIGNTRTVTNADGKQTIYALGAGQGAYMHITSIQGQASANCVAGDTTYGYDGNGYVNQRTDAENRTTIWTNDAKGNPLTQTDGSGTALARSTTMSWLSAYPVPTQIVKPGLTISLMYDSAGRLTQRTETDTTTQTIPYSTNGDTRTWAFGYNASGLLISVDGPLSGTSDTTTYSYNASGFLSSVTNALNQTTQITSVNSLGQPLTIVDPNNITTNFTYDARGHLTQIVVNPGAQQAVTSFGYDAAEQVISATEPNGAALIFEYDGAKRLSAIQNNAGERIEYTRNAMGGITNTNVRDSSGSIVKAASKTFDELNRVLTEIGANSQVTHYGYDRTNNVTAVTDPVSNTFSYGYDALNRLASEAGPSSYTVGYAYNSRDQVTTVTDPQGYATNYYYDGFGDVIAKVSPDSGTTIYTYDARGLQLVEAKSNNVVSSRSYDVLGRLTDITYSNTSENIHYSYDGTNISPVPANSTGRLTGMTDQTGTTSYTYNPRGTLFGELKAAFGTSYLTLYAYDNSDNVAQIQYPTGDLVTYVRNAMGQVTEVDVNIAGVTQILASSIQYKPFGPWSQMTLPNGITTTRTFDQDYRIASISSTGVLSRSYGFDLRNYILSISDGIAPAKSQSLTYDALGHLQTANGGYGSLTYTYNASGDRLTGGLTASASIYTYQSGSHRLSSVNAPNSHSYTYDGAGNIASDGTITYAFNDEGRLFAASSAGSPIYFYDGYGHRAAKYVTGPGSTVYTRLLNEQIALETSGTGQVSKEYFYLGGEPLAVYSPASGVNIWVGVANPAPTKTGSNISDVYYYSNDHLATPQILTNATGSVSWSADYQPFGSATVTTASVTNSLRLPGQYFDGETSFHQNGFRDYDPSLGRYIESDPIGLHGGINTYAYAFDRPTNVIDPTGRGVKAGALCEAGAFLYSLYDTFQNYTDATNILDDSNKQLQDQINLLNERIAHCNDLEKQAKMLDLLHGLQQAQLKNLQQKISSISNPVPGFVTDLLTSSTVCGIITIMPGP